MFSYLTQTLAAPCDRPQCRAGTPRDPVCRSRSRLRQEPPAVWQWSFFHCRCLLSDQSHRDEEGGGTCPGTEETRDTTNTAALKHEITGGGDICTNVAPGSETKRLKHVRTALDVHAHSKNSHHITRDTENGKQVHIPTH